MKNVPLQILRVILRSALLIILSLVKLYEEMQKRTWLRKLWRHLIELISMQ